jgi:ribosome biogenesis GTPase / thiamine phosphate phosphatase
VLTAGAKEGLVVKAQSGFFTVETGEGLFVCRLRGKLKRGRASGDIAALGDRVRITALPDGTGAIEQILPRQRAIVRLDPRPQGLYQQVLLANPDQALFVFACAHPEPRLRMLDRFLVVAEKQKVPAVIVANKVDLVGMQPARALFEMYRQPGYRVIYTSAVDGTGLDELGLCLEGKLSALAGPSGAGKSSLLNAIQPGLGLAVNALSTVDKGQHTTVVRQLFPLEGRGYVADTPGWKSLALWDITPEELDAYFPEIAPLVAHCQFSDCTHAHEPGCAVRLAVEEGRVHPERYESYIRMRQGQEQ